MYYYYGDFEHLTASNNINDVHFIKFVMIMFIIIIVIIFYFSTIIVKEQRDNKSEEANDALRWALGQKRGKWLVATAPVHSDNNMDNSNNNENDNNNNKEKKT